MISARNNPAELLVVLGAITAQASCGGALASTTPGTGSAGPAWPEPRCDVSGADGDHDGLSDDCEARAAERFAPVVIHSARETAFPTDVDDLLARSSLAERDDACARGVPRVTLRAPTQDALLGRVFRSPCDGSVVTSDGSRSDRKHRTFFLADVDREARAGSPDPVHWRTYVHAYPNDVGGMTVQYWRVYAYDSALAGHGGDWESAQVVLDRSGEVARVRLLGHTSIEDLPRRALGWEGTHPIVYSEARGHASRASGDSIASTGCVESDACAVSLDDLATFVRQETWDGGRVLWPDGRVSRGGGLVNIGEKSHPLHGQAFVRYSGLWGSPGRFYMSSGYWGPAYNETEMRPDGFVTAWCYGMAGRLDRAEECWPGRR